MKKASDICLIIGGVLAILNAIGFIAAGIVMFVFSGPAFKQMIIDGLNNHTIKSDIPGTPEEIATAIQIIFLTLGCVFLPLAAFAILSAVFSFLGVSKRTNVFYVLNIVFGVIGASIVNTVGGVIGLLVPEGER